MLHLPYLISVEKKCYVMDLAASTKAWTAFTDLPGGCAYNAMVYVEKVNRLYSVGCETGLYGSTSWVGSLVVSFRYLY